MSVHSVQDLKQTLLGHGFEVFRTLGSRVVLADRVRENLIMDSCVSVVCSPDLANNGFGVRIVLRAQGEDFPGETEEQLFLRVLRHGDHLGQRGYTEVERAVVPLANPGDPTRRLDTWYEVSFQRQLEAEQNLQEELRYLLSIVKTVA